MIILVDYNLNREAILLSGSLVNGGWLDLNVNFQCVTLTAKSLRSIYQEISSFL
ncbi:hypothetical protein [Dapis sp. BLCC M229]|uniref:hypothetical protein n=1 Tax=Dapis sp. BLCC M229 TaxID=3400188 RepID=UPI003CEB8617